MADLADTVKLDPEDEPFSPIADEDEYEDTGELELPKEMPQAWMIKVPKEIYTDWSDINNDEPIQLGVLRKYTSGPRAGKVRVVILICYQRCTHTSLQTFVLLDRRVPINEKLPGEYEMKHIPANGNTFLFSEKDVPNQRRAMVKKDTTVTQGQNGVQKSREKGRPWRSRTIAKQTKLAAEATQEAVWLAVENDDYKRTMSQRRVDELNNRNTIEVLKGDARLFGGGMLKPKGRILSRPANAQRDAGFGGFVVSFDCTLQFMLLSADQVRKRTYPHPKPSKIRPHVCRRTNFWTFYLKSFRSIDTGPSGP